MAKLTNTSLFSSSGERKGTENPASRTPGRGRHGSNHLRRHRGADTKPQDIHQEDRRRPQVAPPKEVQEEQELEEEEEQSFYKEGKVFGVV